MTSTGRDRWLLPLAVVDALGAVVGTLAFFGIAPGSFNDPWIWLVLAAIIGSGLIFVVYIKSERSRPTAPGEPPPAAAGRDMDPSAGPDTPAPASTTIQRLLARLLELRIHRLVTLAAWSTLASLVAEYMTSSITGFLLIALGPLWVLAGSFAATQITAGHRLSSVTLAGLLCGIFGAWLGSGGDAGAQLGFVWGCMAGGLAADYLATNDARMSLALALISTAIILGCTASIIDVKLMTILREPSGFVNSGVPLFMLETQNLLGIYLIRLLLRRRGTALNDSNPSKQQRRGRRRGRSK